MAAKESRSPVSIFHEDQRSYLATTGDPESFKREWRLVPNIALLEHTGRQHELRFASPAPAERHLAENLIRYHVRTALSRIPELWNDSPGTFYLRDSGTNSRSGSIEVVRGFVFRLHYIESEGLFVSLDPLSTYIDRRSLSETLKNNNDPRDVKMQHFVYRSGHSWYRVQVLGTTDRCISEQIFVHEGDKQTYKVYDYILKKAHKPLPAYVSGLDPQSPTILYRYPNSSNDFYGAAALAFRTYHTDHPDVRQLHSLSILEPAARLSKSKEFIRKYFQNVQLADQHLNISEQPLTCSARTFRVPDFLFGHGHILAVRQGPSERGVALKDLGRKKMETLLQSDAGFLATDALQAHFIFAPTSLQRPVAEGFISELEKQMTKFLGRRYEIKTILYDDRNSQNLRQQVQAIKNAVDKNRIDRGGALLILPTAAHDELHNFIKRELFKTLQFQCVSATSLLRHFHRTNGAFAPSPDMAGRFASYTRYVALGLLLANHRWPFALNQNLHHDVHIGIDVLNTMAGFTYIYNNAKDCYFRHHRSGQSEKLTKNQLYTVLYEELRNDISRLGITPRSILIHRDGNSFSQEEEGITLAIRRLQTDGFLSSDAQYGVVEIHKSTSSRIRIFTADSGHITNPTIGTYFIINKTEGIVCNTGVPYRFPGTASPLSVRIAAGSVTLTHALHDIFALSQLTWSAPDRPSRVPITTKLGDLFLRPLAADSDEDALYEADDNLPTTPPNGDTTIVSGAVV